MRRTLVVEQVLREEGDAQQQRHPSELKQSGAYWIWMKSRRGRIAGAAQKKLHQEDVRLPQGDCRLFVCLFDGL